MACAQGSLEIVQLFTGEDRDICKAEIMDDQGMVPLHRAALNNHSTVVSFLLDQVTELKYIVTWQPDYMLLKKTAKFGHAS